MTVKAIRCVSGLHAGRIAALLAVACASAASAGRLVINEIQVANVDRYIDPSYNYGAWIELYNPGMAAIQLNGCTLRHTDADGNVDLCRLGIGHGSVPSGGYGLLWFDHNSADGYYGGYAGTQIPFKLDADGGLIELLDGNGGLIDAASYPQCIARCSWARTADGGDAFGWTSQPTPKVSNGTSTFTDVRMEAPVVSAAGGVFRGSYRFTVAIPDGATLYYTTDGSTPEPGRSPVSRDGSFGGSENAVYRFMLSCDGKLDSPVVTRSFFNSLVGGGYSLPILSVNTAPENFFDDTIGLYVKGTNGRVANNSKVKANQNMDWERPVNVEYFVPDATMHYAEALNQGANFSICGGYTRFNYGNEDFEHRTSFKLKSDKVFEGLNTFAYPLFGCKPYIKIKNFIVRNGGQDSKARIWDAAIQELLRTSGVYLDCQAWQPAHVYLNGKHLGLMNLREESNKQFAFSNYGIDKDEIDQWEGDIVIKEGDRQKLDEWYALSHRLAANPTDTAIWNDICELVDIDEYCNYMAAEIYMGNLDWLRGGFKNLKGFRARDGNGKFHIVLHDVDGGFGDTDMILQVLNKGTGSLPVRFKNMLRYEPFRKQFIDAYCIMNGSVFDPERCVPIITAMRDAINPALKLEGSSADEKAGLLVSRLCDNDKRRPALKQSLVKAFGLHDDYTVVLRSSTPGTRLLLNGKEIPTGRFDGYLFPPIVLTSSAPDGYSFEAWSVNGKAVSQDSILYLSESNAPGTYDIEAVYRQAEACLSPICINEVSSGNDIFINEYGKKADWIELYNNTAEDYDLAGACLSDDPQNPAKYRIPSSDAVSTVIPAHGYKIVWFDGKEPKTQLHASFKLKNSAGAYISITGADGLWADSLRYDMQPRWNTYGRFPDGGHTLAMFGRPTIGNPNSICAASGYISDGIGNPTADEKANRQIQTIRYYNLQGVQVSNPEAWRIVIQHIIYIDGSSMSRKVFMY